MKHKAIALAAMLTAAMLTGCGSKDSSSSAASNSPAAQNSAASSAADSSSAAAADSKTAKSTIILDGSKCGVLQKAADQDAFTISGLLLAPGSGHHDYPLITDLITDGYKTEGLFSTYYRSEWFEIYGDCNKPVNIYVVQNQPDTDYAAMTEADLQTINDNSPYPNSITDAVPNAEDYGHLWSTYVHQEMEPGLYNVCFVSGGKLCYLVQLNIEPLSE